MLAAARAHLAERGQSHTLTAHFEFLNRASTGPGIITVEELKLGRQTSTLLLTLWQGDGLLSEAPWVTNSKTQRTVIALATQTNLEKATGFSAPTGWAVTDAKFHPAKPDLDSLLKNGGDQILVEAPIPKGSDAILNSLKQWHMFIPRNGSLSPGTLDMWMCLRSGEPITQATLPFVADGFPYSLLDFLVSPQFNEDKKKRLQSTDADPEPDLWMPTIAMNLDTKKLLPENGVKWLNTRATGKAIKNGNLDIELVVRDEDGEIVALSQQVLLILTMARNMARSTKPKSSL